MTDYIPINCNLHDHLEALATLHKRCRIIYQITDDKIVETIDTIEDIYTKNKEEFAVLGSGKTIRLDALLKAGGQSFVTTDSP